MDPILMAPAQMPMATRMMVSPDLMEKIKGHVPGLTSSSIYPWLSAIVGGLPLVEEKALFGDRAVAALSDGNYILIGFGEAA